jgi:hypothetical protein
MTPPVAEAQFTKCRSWVLMAIVPFYQKTGPNPGNPRRLSVFNSP